MGVQEEMHLIPETQKLIIPIWLHEGRNTVRTQTSKCYNLKKKITSVRLSTVQFNLSCIKQKFIHVILLLACSKDLCCIFVASSKPIKLKMRHLFFK